MADVIARYLERKTDFTRWQPQGEVPDSFDAVVVIPCLAESTRLFLTLQDLREQDPHCLSRTLVLCAVNNRPVGIAREEDIADNLATLERLAAWHAAPLNLAWIDAASPGLEMPADGGVGLARKIGLDWGLRLLHERTSEKGILICLDADTRVARDYLSSIFDFYAQPRWAGLLPYAHPLEESPELQPILCYEFFLRYHELGLRYAGSPYAFHTIGSTMTCTARAYAAVCGMNRKQAGEDFYFLQQLAKTGPVERIPATPVTPAARASHRVPFGTGRRVERHLAGERDEFVLYHPESYSILREWLEVLNRGGQETEVMEQALRIASPLEDFLVQQDFPRAFSRILQQSRQEAQRRAQIHRWFDGFRTLKLIHFLRDHAYPEVEMFGAIVALLQMMEAPEQEYFSTLGQGTTLPDIEQQIRAMRSLRRLCDHTMFRGGVIA